MRFRLLILFALFVSSVSAQRRVVFSPQWTAQAQFVGYYVAKDMGFYDEVGLNVEIRHPFQSISSLEMLKRGDSDFITLDLITAMSENMDGAELCNLYQSSQASSLAVISHSRIKHLNDLTGQRVGRWSAGFSLVPQSAIDYMKVDIEWVDILGGVNVFLSKAVDANLMMTYNELLTVEETGYEMDPSHVIYFRDIEEYNIPEDGLYTTSSFAEENPDVVRRFCEATRKGWMWARENREKALDVVMQWVLSEKVPTNKVHQKMMLDEVLSLQVADESGEVSTTLNKKDFDRALMLLMSSDISKNIIEYESFVNRSRYEMAK